MPVVTKTYVMTYRDTVTLPAELTLTSARELTDKCREFGTAEPHGYAIEFELVHEGDLWELRGIVDEIAQVFESYGVEYVAEKERIVRSVPVQ